jgi:hypothetical protein
LIFKFRERHKGRKSTLLRERIIELGFKHLQSGVWILPPVKTPYNVNFQEELRQWVRKNLIDPIDGELEYVFPFVALLDLRT